MSDIQKIKESIDELDRLNGEIGRVKGVLDSLNKDIQDIEVVKANAQVDFNKDMSLKDGQSKRLDNQIQNKTAELNEVEVSIGKNKLILEDQEKATEIHIKAMDADIAQEKENKRILKERKDSLDSFEKLLKDREINILYKEKTIVEKEKLLDNREESLNIQTTNLDSGRNDLLGKILKVKEKEDKADETIRIFTGKNSELDKQEINLKIKSEEVSTREINVHDKELQNSKKEQDLKVIQESLIARDSDMSKKEASLIKRETDVILREAECRVREKTLNIANREKQLDEQV